jgi:predicted Rossmann fold nucleotide-binding protein DprA/Smf involved in DNA uptake
MTEIAQLFESALRQNRASLLRKAAMNTVGRMPPETTLRELLQSDAGEAIRELSLRDLGKALAEAGLEPRPGAKRGRRLVAGGQSDDWSESREERIYKQILDVMADEPLTIGQLGKRLDIDVDELRGYLTWMKKMGKVTSSGRARATRYQAVRSGGAEGK